MTYVTIVNQCMQVYEWMCNLEYKKIESQLCTRWSRDLSHEILTKQSMYVKIARRQCLSLIEDRSRAKIVYVQHFIEMKIKLKARNQQKTLWDLNKKIERYAFKQINEMLKLSKMLQFQWHDIIFLTQKSSKTLAILKDIATSQVCLKWLQHNHNFVNERMIFYQQFSHFFDHQVLEIKLVQSNNELQLLEHVLEIDFWDSITNFVQQVVFQTWQHDAKSLLRSKLMRNLRQYFDILLESEDEKKRH